MQVPSVHVLAAAVAAVVAINTSVAYAQSETQILRSVAGDKGKYYLLESKKVGDVVHALHKRIGVDSIDFTRTETNCKTRKMREIGTGEGSVQKIKVNPTKWFDLVPGSSKSDLAQFVCKW